MQLIFTNHRFKLLRSAYMQICFGKYWGCFSPTAGSLDADDQLLAFIYTFYIVTLFDSMKIF